MPLRLVRIGSKVYTTLAVGKLNRKEFADPYSLVRLCLRSMKFLNLEQAEISNPKLLTAKQKANKRRQCCWQGISPSSHNCISV